MSLAWMVIYPRGNRAYLDIAEVIDYEQREWSLASETRFDYEEDAANYAWQLSLKYDIPINKNSDSKQLWILDREE